MIGDTYIYWLVDIRPEILQHHSSGFPFYCGKTIDPATRLKAHKRVAYGGEGPDRIAERLQRCPDHFIMHIVATVPLGDNDNAVEARWIDVLRWNFPDNANTVGARRIAPSKPEMERRSRRRDEQIGRLENRCKKADRDYRAYVISETKMRRAKSMVFRAQRKAEREKRLALRRQTVNT